MPRAFYDCPLKAAYMVKYYGMKLGQSDNGYSTGWKEWIAPMELDAFYQGLKISPAYIHPDSLHLLEPQEGDILECSGFSWEDSTLGYAVKEVYGVANKHEYEYLIPINNVTGTSNFRILQRNGLAFMWPSFESEESK